MKTAKSLAELIGMLVAWAFGLRSMREDMEDVNAEVMT